MICYNCYRTGAGVKLIGMGSLIVFGSMAVVASVLLGLNHQLVRQLFYNNPVLGIDGKMISMRAILLGNLIISMLGTVFSVLFLIGVFKNKSGMVLSYFCFGVLAVNLMLLACVLLVLHRLWYVAIGLFIFTVLYIICLPKVYAVYEWLSRGSLIVSQPADSMEDELLNTDD